MKKLANYAYLVRIFLASYGARDIGFQGVCKTLIHTRLQAEKWSTKSL